MMRTMLESLISEKGGSKKSLRSDLHAASLPDFELFHRNTFYFNHILNFDSESVKNICPFILILYVYLFTYLSILTYIKHQYASIHLFIDPFSYSQRML